MEIQDSSSNFIEIQTRIYCENIQIPTTKQTKKGQTEDQVAIQR